MITSDAQLHQAQIDVRPSRAPGSGSCHACTTRLSAPGRPLSTPTAREGEGDSSSTSHDDCIAQCAGSVAVTSSEAAWAIAARERQASGVGHDGLDGVTTRTRNPRTREKKTMNVEVAFSGSVRSGEALARFLKHLEVLVPQPVEIPKVMMADDGGVYVKARFATEEEAWSAGEKMAEVGADIVEETDVLVALAPFAHFG